MLDDDDNFRSSATVVNKLVGTIQVSGCILLGVAVGLWWLSGDRLAAEGLMLSALVILDAVSYARDKQRWGNANLNCVEREVTFPDRLLPQSQAFQNLSTPDHATAECIPLEEIFDASESEVVELKPSRL